MDRPKTPGFSLLELLITLAIVAILATITIPYYSGYVAKSRRADAMSALVLVQLAQERWRSEHPAFAGDLATLGWLSRESPDGYYRLQIASASAVDYLVLARPTGAQQADSCGIFAIGPKGPEYTRGYAGEACWNR